MTSSNVSSQPRPPMPAARKSRLADRATAFTPLIVGLILFVAPVHHFAPFLVKPPEIQGVPLGVVLAALAAVWMLFGVAVVWNAGSRLTRMLGLLLFTIPATIVVVLGPGLLLIVQTLD